MGPMIAAHNFTQQVRRFTESNPSSNKLHIQCTLKDSLAYTGVGHATDRAIALGLHGHLPDTVVNEKMNKLIEHVWTANSVVITTDINAAFFAEKDIIFDTKHSLKQHPNGMVFALLNDANKILISQTYFSIGGGFILTLEEIDQVTSPITSESSVNYPFPFATANEMLQMSAESSKTIWQMKQENELQNTTKVKLNAKLDNIWDAMKTCLESGLVTEGILPGGLGTPRRAKKLNEQLESAPEDATINEWLCAYAMAVNEENAAGHMVVTAPTNGAAGVVPAVLYYYYKHKSASIEQIRQYLLTTAAIGGLIKHNSSISGAEMGCQGEVGSASAMAAAGLTAVQGGTTAQIENAAEMALEHHMGMTCDPIKGLVQVPCIERNGFGAVKAYTASSISLRENGKHIVSLDQCISAMKQTGLDMSHKYKETSLGGLAVSFVEC